MSKFLSVLEERGLGHLVHPMVWKKVLPCNGQRVAEAVKYIVDNNLSTYIDGDPDPDGLFAAKNIEIMFKKIGYRNYTVGEHVEKRHNISEVQLQNIILGGYRAVIIVDSSSNNLALMRALHEKGILTIIIDHHECGLDWGDFPQSSIVVNPKIDAKHKRINYTHLSAGAICSLVCDYTLSKLYSITENIELYLYGYITMYSDSVNMNNEYNVSYIRRFRDLDEYATPIIRMFLDQYHTFNRDFVSWRMVPRINAMIRTGHFSKVHRLFYELEEIKDLQSFAADIEFIYRTTRRYQEELVRVCEVEEYENFVAVTIPVDTDIELPDDRGRPIDFVRQIRPENFTGQVAQAFGGQTNKVCICLHHKDSDTYKGSCRDPLNRNILDIFKPLCEAAGHGPAFGFYVPKKHKDSFLYSLKLAGHMLAQGSSDLIVMDWDGLPAREIQSESLMMAEYNEYSGQNLPPALGLMTVNSAIRIYQMERCTKLYYQGMEITAFEPVYSGSRIFISPMSAGTGIAYKVKYSA